MISNFWLGFISCGIGFGIFIELLLILVNSVDENALMKEIFNQNLEKEREK